MKQPVDTNQYPVTIENGAGESLTFVRRVSDPDGDYLEVTNCVQPGAGPPMHVHHMQDEALTVTRGKIGYQLLGGEPQYAGEGETVEFKAGQAHKFWNAGDSELLCEGWVKPPDNIVYFLSAVYDSQKRNGGHEPNRAEAAYLLKRYSSEFGILEIPAFVQKFIFPIQIFIGKLTGKFDRYKDAPEPVRR
jgi:quercetin dioxygenase-like cupin family protein